MANNLIVIVRRRWIKIVIVACVCFIVFRKVNVWTTDEFNERVISIEENYMQSHQDMVDKFYQKRNLWNTSKLGDVLYKNQQYPTLTEQRQKKEFIVLIWKYWSLLKNRHIFYFGVTEHDPLEDCSVTNCIFTGHDDNITTADAVVVHLHRGQIPSIQTRNPNQKWIFLNDESPFNVFALARKKPTYGQLAGMFNWSMTYRSDADIPVPYGRTVTLDSPQFKSYDHIHTIVPNWEKKRRDVLVTIMMSNCVPYRMELIKQLRNFFHVDIYGLCSNKDSLRNRCPGHFKSDCPVIKQYLFYLVLENSKCKEYFTEKLFYNAYANGAIPIIQGPSVEECEKILPPNSYLHIDNYDSYESLATDLIRISRDDNSLLYYHKWRNDFQILNEHGYFGTKSYHLCRLCEALNYNDNTPSVYNEDALRQFLDPQILCRQ